MSALVLTAITLGSVHTILGPDHYIPFIALSKARNWSAFRTLLITVLCGIGHILGSVILGFVGIKASLALSHIEGFEALRGSFAAWGLIAFGLVYGVWGLRRAFKKDNGDSPSNSAVPWVLFIVFALGPCEPLIPLLMYPAAQGNMANVWLVTLAFGAATVFTMSAVVMLASYGVKFIKVKNLSAYSHALAGFAIFMSGFAVEFLGL